MLFCLCAAFPYPLLVNTLQPLLLLLLLLLGTQAADISLA